jgi:hypothetical protein
VRIRFTDFCSKQFSVSSKFTRRPFYPPVVWRTSGQFSVKVGSVKRNASISLPVTKTEAFHFVVLGTFTRRLLGGLTKLP